MLNDAVFATNANFAEETEAPMELEKWMTDESLFNVPASVFTVETESKMELENWMVNENVFEVTPKTETSKLNSAKTFVCEQAVEPKLKLENWMVNEKNWMN